MSQLFKARSNFRRRAHKEPDHPAGKDRRHEKRRDAVFGTLEKDTQHDGDRRQGSDIAAAGDGHRHTGQHDQSGEAKQQFMVLLKPAGQGERQCKRDHHCQKPGQMIGADIGTGGTVSINRRLGLPEDLCGAREELADGIEGDEGRYTDQTEGKNLYMPSSPQVIDKNKKNRTIEDRL